MRAACHSVCKQVAGHEQASRPPNHPANGAVSTAGVTSSEEPCCLLPVAHRQMGVRPPHLPIVVCVCLALQDLPKLGEEVIEGLDLHLFRQVLQGQQGQPHAA